MFAFLQKILQSFNVFPCPVCRTGDGGGRNRICPECLKKLSPLSGPHCRSCGGPVDGILAVCSSCLEEEKRPWYDAAAVFNYTGEAKNLVRRFKFGNFPELAPALGELAAARLREAGFPLDAVVPLPLHYRRYLLRTYNQSELFAAAAAKELHLPLVKALKRKKYTRPQSSLRREKRHQLIKDAFALLPDAGTHLKGKNVLLVDDVFTTGSTLASAAGELRKAGPAAIYVLCIARTPRYAR